MDAVAFSYPSREKATQHKHSLAYLTATVRNYPFVWHRTYKAARTSKHSFSMGLNKTCAAVASPRYSVHPQVHRCGVSTSTRRRNWHGLLVASSFDTMRAPICTRKGFKSWVPTLRGVSRINCSSGSASCAAAQLCRILSAQSRSDNDHSTRCTAVDNGDESGSLRKNSCQEIASFQTAQDSRGGTATWWRVLGIMCRTICPG